MRRSATGDSARVTRWTLGRLAVTSSFSQLQVATSLLEALTSFTRLAKRAAESFGNAMQEDFVEEEEEDQWNGWQARCAKPEGLCLFPGKFRLENETQISMKQYHR